MSWVDVGPRAPCPRAARALTSRQPRHRVFRTGTSEVFALRDRCPHRGGPLSQGIVHGTRVTCPLHDWVIDLKSGCATGVDEGSTPTYGVRIVDGRVEIDLPASAEARSPHSGRRVRSLRACLTARSSSRFGRAHDVPVLRRRLRSQVVISAAERRASHAECDPRGR